MLFVLRIIEIVQFYRRDRRRRAMFETVSRPGGSRENLLLLMVTDECYMRLIRVHSKTFY